MHLIKQSICDSIPLDKLRKHSTLPYITWGLVQDFKNKKENGRMNPLHLRMGEDGTTAFLPLDSRTGGHVRNDRPSVGQFFTRKQDNYIYKKIETGEIISTDAIEQEIKQEEQLNRIDDISEETIPYCKVIVNNAEKI